MNNKDISRRDYFVGQAMAGLCAATNPDGTWAHDEVAVACAAITYADWVIRLLGSEEEEGK